MDDHHTTPRYAEAPRIQGQDDVIINAPASAVWPLIKDSRRLEDWGPPVQKVEVYLAAGQHEEGVGSRRKVFAKFSEKRTGWYEEIRTEQVEGRKVTFLIYEDSFGMGKILKDVGATMELVPEGPDRTRFIFTFYHRPKNVMGWLMNALIRMDQRKNRLRALRSIKRYAEGGAAIKT
jgi:hypothetical protein